MLYTWLLLFLSCIVVHILYVLNLILFKIIVLLNITKRLQLKCRKQKMEIKIENKEKNYRRKEIYKEIISLFIITIPLGILSGFLANIYCFVLFLLFLVLSGTILNCSFPSSTYLSFR